MATEPLARAIPCEQGDETILGRALASFDL